MLNQVIEVEEVKQQFGKQVVLEDVNLQVKKGEILGILGPSGSGKTTLIKLIVGMGIPTSGRVKVLGEAMPSLALVKKIGYMAQSDALYEDLNAYDNLLFFGALYGLKGKEALERAKEILALVKLSEDGKKAIRFFSGGMKRRLSLAIALFHRPDIVILDEPTVGIDPVLREEFWKEFRRLKDLGTTIIITTHVMDEAENCDRLALIRDGNIIALDSPEDLKKKSGVDTIEKVFLHYGRQKEAMI